MACIDNLVVSGICDDTQSETGYRLIDAPGMNVRNFADIATDSSGVQMVEDAKRLTLIQVKNDFIGALQMNKVVTQMANPKYNSSVFRPTNPVGSGNNRGLILRRKNPKGGLTKIKIHTIEVYPLSDGTGTIEIIDNGYSTSWGVDLVGGQVNVFTSEATSALPYTLASTMAEVTLTTDVAMASAEVICRTGCNGTTPNECGYVNGWDGNKEVKKESYGLNIYFGCECDYEQIICDTKAMFGELIWLKWQINIFREQYMSNRFDNWVIYGREELEKYIPQLENMYATKWNQMMDGLFGILKQYRDACLDCRSNRWVTNI